MALLQAHHLVKRYRRFTAVRDASFEVGPGEIVGLLGPNGAGKTTSFYMVVGLVACDGGALSLSGHDITHLAMHQRARLGIGYLPQEASVFRKLSVLDNVIAALEVHSTLPRQRQRERAQTLLDALHIGPLAEHPAITLSGGERRRVEIARALAGDPKIILLDEPFAGVDPISVLDIQHIIQQLRERGLAVLITDHNVRETLRICDRAYILNQGSVIAAGDPQTITDNRDVRRVYLGDQFQT